MRQFLNFRLLASYAKAPNTAGYKLAFGSKMKQPTGAEPAIPTPVRGEGQTGEKSVRFPDRKRRTSGADGQRQLLQCGRSRKDRFSQSPDTRRPVSAKGWTGRERTIRSRRSVRRQFQSLPGHEVVRESTKSRRGFLVAAAVSFICYSGGSNPLGGGRLEYFNIRHIFCLTFTDDCS